MACWWNKGLLVCCIAMLLLTKNAGAKNDVESSAENNIKWFVGAVTEGHAVGSKIRDDVVRREKTLNQAIDDAISKTCFLNAFWGGVGATLWGLTTPIPVIGPWLATGGTTANKLRNSMYYQIVLASAVATIHGHNMLSPHAAGFVSLALAGDLATEVGRQAAVDVVNHAFQTQTGAWIAQGIDSALAVLSEKILAELGIQAVISVVPGVGGIISSSIDYTVCVAVAKTGNLAIFGEIPPIKDM